MPEFLDPEPKTQRLAQPHSDCEPPRAGASTSFSASLTHMRPRGQEEGRGEWEKGCEEQKQHPSFKSRGWDCWVCLSPGVYIEWVVGRGPWVEESWEVQGHVPGYQVIPRK